MSGGTSWEDGEREIQFHYKKCPVCGHYEIFEYRETPSWWADFWGLDRPFTKGSLEYEDLKKLVGKQTRNVEFEITKW